MPVERSVARWNSPTRPGGVGVRSHTTNNAERFDRHAFWNNQQIYNPSYEAPHYTRPVSIGRAPPKLSDNALEQFLTSHNEIDAGRDDNDARWMLRVTNAIHLVQRLLTGRGKMVRVFYRKRKDRCYYNDPYPVEHRHMDMTLDELGEYLTYGGLKLVIASFTRICRDGEETEKGVGIYKEYCEDYCCGLHNLVALQATATHGLFLGIDQDGVRYPVAVGKQNKLVGNGEIFAPVVTRRLKQNFAEGMFHYIRIPPGNMHRQENLPRRSLRLAGPTPIRYRQKFGEMTCVQAAFCSALHAFGFPDEAQRIYERSAMLPPDDALLSRFHNIVTKELKEQYQFVRPKNHYDPLVDVAAVPVIAKLRDRKGQLRHCVAFLGNNLYEPSQAESMEINRENLDAICGGKGRYGGVYWYKTLKSLK